jgi:predicted amidophosphoribosyltransferase
MNYRGRLKIVKALADDERGIKMAICKMCREEIPDGREFCDECSNYISKSYEEMNSEAKYQEDMRKDAFGN